ncbi:hypothetical protein [Paractinoplanes durhamensis]|uniref:Ig-like domain-containing protein n=1 Tax=Paractinoplanes durhamensis TaxID=113563 RepID=A0ABQ3YYX5_9ACTN|nr:hypothetical protein [Actinoplanes durhamensis]GIE02780.1 hypothetical protein Adu01nite_41300 [Actinoplanes durhamensis]
MGFIKAAKAVFLAALLMVSIAVVPGGPALAATTAPIPADCAAATLGTSYDLEFTTTVRSTCLLLPELPANSKVGVFGPANSSELRTPRLTVLTGDGTVICSGYGTWLFDCTLTGTGPFRVVATAANEVVVGPYKLALQRLSGDAGCRTDLPLGRIGADSGLDVSFDDEHGFVSCFAMPRGTHSTRELVSAERVAGRAVDFAVYDQATGSRACARPGTASIVQCDLNATRDYSLVVLGPSPAATSRVTRRDTTYAALSCDPVTSTELGGPASAGALGRLGDARCFQVTVPAGDRFLMGLRSDTGNRFQWVTDNNGTFCYGSRACTTTVWSVDMTYRLVVWKAMDSSAPVPFQLDTWQILGHGTLSPKCQESAPIVSATTLSGTFTDQDTARCVVTTVASKDEYRIAIDGGDPYDNRSFLFDPWYLIGSSGHWATAGCDAVVSRCTATGILANEAPRKAIFLLTPGTQFGDFPYQAQITCLTTPCGGDAYAVSGVSPATVPAGVSVVLTLTGAAFDAADTVQLTRAGAAPISAVVESVSADRHTLTARVDLAGAAAGAWSVTATSAATHATATLAGPFTVIGPNLVSTQAPSISGAIRVGSTVRAVPGVWSPAATSYGYQWAANGSAIKGATGVTYTIPPALRGLRLSVVVTARRPDYLAGARATAYATVGYGVAPKASALPKISGTVKAGKTVKVSVGTWSPKPTAYRYEWRLNGKLISTSSAVKLTKAMKGKKLTVTVVAKRTGHLDGRATSKSVKVG